MGQRLNIEICDNAKTLANAYYHWSAYTSSALEMMTAIIETYYELSDKINDKVELAVELLQATDAGINREEKERIKNNPDFAHINFQPCIDRNEGLLAVTEEGIEETRCYEEGRVTINIENETFCFEVFFEYTKQEYEEDYGIEALSKLSKIKHNILYDYLPFSKVDWLNDFIKNNPAGVIANVNDSVIKWIE